MPSVHYLYRMLYDLASIDHLILLVDNIDLPSPIDESYIRQASVRPKKVSVIDYMSIGGFVVE
jgi:hypothetical protein